MSRPITFVSVYGLSRRAERFYAKRALEGLAPSAEAVAALKADERGILRRTGKPERIGILGYRESTHGDALRKPKLPREPRVSRDTDPPVVWAHERRLMELAFWMRPRPVRLTHEECFARKAAV